MLNLIKELQALAQTGLHYGKDHFDLERYQRIREIAFAMMAEKSDLECADFARFFLPEKGYATPKVDLRGCVIRDGRILLVRERSDGLWTMPGGWADQNESPEEGVVREIREESGFDTRVVKLYAVRDRDRHPYLPKYPVSLYKLFFLAEIVGGDAEINPEISEIAFFAPDELPPLSVDRLLPEDIAAGFRHAEKPELPTEFD